MQGMTKTDFTVKVLRQNGLYYGMYRNEKTDFIMECTATKMDFVMECRETKTDFYYGMVVMECRATKQDFYYGMVVMECTATKTDFYYGMYSDPNGLLLWNV